MPAKLQVKPKAPPGRRGGRGGSAAAGAASTAGSASTEGSTPTTTPTTSGNAPTAATTRSIAPPVGRLDSLKLTPPNASPGASGSGSGSGSATPVPGGGLRGKTPLRFKPKAVLRKTAEERAKLEASITPLSSSSTPIPGTDASTGDPKTTTTTSSARGGSSRGPRGGGDLRGRGSRGRGRGRGGSEGGYQSVTSTASGPFALGSVTSGRSKVLHERGTELREATSKSTKKSSRGISIDEGGVRIKSERDGPFYYSETDDESDGGPKINVERIEELLESEEEEEEGDVEMKGAKMPAMFPLRVERYRHEEKERAVPIFKDPETSGSKKGKGGGRKVKVENLEADVVDELKEGLEGLEDGDSKKEDDKDKDKDEVKVKAEPLDDGDISLADAPPIPIDPDAPQAPSSPELSKKTPLRSSQSPEAKRKPRRRNSGRARRASHLHSLMLSPEEEMEIKMEEEDRQATLRELGMDGAGRGGEAAQAEDGSDMGGIRNGEMFFFQFPTVVPPLERIASPGLVKGVVGGVVDGGGVGGDTAGKPDPAKKTGAKKKFLDLRSLEKQVFPEGVVGQLRVHRSGRVSILWGNPDPPNQDPSKASPLQSSQPPNSSQSTQHTQQAQPIELTLTRGAHCEFLQDVVVMNPTPRHPTPHESTPKDEEKGADEGVLGIVNRGVVDPKSGKKVGGVWSLGQVRGRFVVQPEWERLVGGGRVGER